MSDRTWLVNYIGEINIYRTINGLTVDQRWNHSRMTDEIRHEF